jgi:hypothetical protein
MAYNSIDSKTAQNLILSITKWRNNHSLITAKNERWYIGITNNSSKRKKEHEIDAKNEGFEVSYFEFWDAKTVNIALAVETYWHDRGMLETDRKGNFKVTSRYIYVYKKYPLFKLLK